MTDLTDGEYKGLFPIESRTEATVGTLLLDSMGIPSNIDVTRRIRGDDGASSKLTFYDLWSFLYVEQSEIDQSIAHHTDTFRESKRRAVFELMFGLADQDSLGLKVKLAVASKRLTELTRDRQAIVRFLAEAETESRMAATAAQESALQERTASLARVDSLRREADPGDERTEALRDLLAVAEEQLAGVRNQLDHLDRKQKDRAGIQVNLRQELTRLSRRKAAVGYLADIEFIVCPRCAQSIKDRPVPRGSCPLCLQHDPVWDESSALQAGDPSSQELDGSLFEDDEESYEQRQLSEQISETEGVIATAGRERSRLLDDIRALSEQVQRLSALIDERTRDRVSPRLQAYADASAAVVAADAKLERVEGILRLWAQLGELETGISDAKRDRDTLAREAGEAANRLRAGRLLLSEMSSDFQEIVQRLGVPGVKKAAIDPNTYLPLINDTKFDRFSPPGGIRTAVILGYWITLLAAAIRHPETLFPAFLLIDSPRSSIGAEEALAENLYRQLETLVDSNRKRLQIVVGDNELPASYKKRHKEILFNYDNPVVTTIAHPGPAVQTLHAMTPR